MKLRYDLVESFGTDTLSSAGSTHDEGNRSRFARREIAASWSPTGGPASP